MSIFTDIIGMVGSGGITGIIGGGITLLKSYTDNKQRLEELAISNKHALAVMEKQNELNVILAEKNITLETNKALAEAEAASVDLFKTGLDYAKTEVGTPATDGIVLRFVEGFRRFFRPFVSYYSTIILTAMSYWVYDLWTKMNLALTQDQAYALTKLMLETNIYIATTAIFWWFTTRIEKPSISIGKK